MEQWLEVTKLGGTAILAFIAWALWGKLEKKDLELAAKDVKIAELNEKRIQDLKAIAKLDD